MIPLVIGAKVDPYLVGKIHENGSVQALVILKDVGKTSNEFGLVSTVENDKIRDSVLKSVKLNAKNNFTIVNSFLTDLDEKSLEKLKKNPNVEAIYFDKEYFVSLENSVIQTNATTVNAISFSNNLLRGAGSSVCVLDTGINYSHPDFGSCTSTTIHNGVCTKVRGGWDYLNSDSDPYDDQGHGTHVSGIMGANGTLLGVAPDVTIIPIKVCNSADPSSCSLSAIISGLQWCANNATAFNITAISMSFATSVLYTSACDDSSSLTSYVNSAFAKNITLIASTGNDGSTTGIGDPSCITNVTSVGAVSDSDALIYNRNSITDILAPGVNINSTSWDQLYEVLSGTSMSTPHVSGAVAIMQQYKKLEKGSYSLTTTINTALKQGKNISDSSSGLTFPRLNILASLINLDETQPLILEVVPSNNSVFNFTDIELNFTASDVISLFGCYYNINSASANTTISNCVNTTVDVRGGNNTLVLYANDSNNNINQTSTVLFTIQNITTELNNFSDFTNLSYNDLTFNCSSYTNINLQNVSFYIDISSSFILNQTFNITGVSNVTSFSINNVPDGTYKWNCLSFDVSNRSNFALTNNTFTVDTGVPILTSISSGSLTVSSATITWTTNELANSTVYYGTTVATSSSSVSSSLSTSHSISLSSLSSSTLYYYNVSSCDIIGNCNTSSQFNFTTSSSPSGSSGSSGGGGGGGGGGGSSSPDAIVISKSLKNLKAGDSTSILFSSLTFPIEKLTFSVSKDTEGNLNVEAFDKLPNIMPSPPGKVNKYLQLKTEGFDSSNINNAIVEFKISKKWLELNNLKVNNIGLMRFNNNWKELEIEFVGENRLNAYYKAKSPGFSYFVIHSRASYPIYDINIRNTNTSEQEPVYYTTEESVNITKDVGSNIKKEKTNFRYVLYLVIAILIIIILVLFVYIELKSYKK